MKNSGISKFGFIIVVLIGLMLFLTLASTSINSIQATDLGLASKLPFFFWIALILICYLWYLSISKYSKIYLVAALAYTILSLFLVPSVIKVPVTISNSFYPYGESLLINSSGHLVNRPFIPLFSYHAWPIFLYLASILKLVTGISDAMLLKFFPVFIISLYALLTLAILKTKLKIQYAALGAAWVLGSYWLRQQYFGPQSIAYVFFLLMFFLASWLFFTEKPRKKSVVALVVLLLIVVTATHILTAFFAITMLVSLYIVQNLFLKKPVSSSAGLCLFSVLFFLAYSLYFAPGFFTFAIERVGQSIAQVSTRSVTQEASRSFGSFANFLNYTSSWSIVLFGAIIAAISLLPLVKKLFTRKSVKGYGFEIFCGMSLILIVLYGFTLQYGMHESYQRAFMFGLIPIAYLCINFLKNRPKILVAIISILIFLNIPAQYGSDSFRLATNQQLSGAQFFADFSPQETSCFDHFSLYTRYFDPAKILKVQTISAVLSSENDFNITQISGELQNVTYVIRTQLQDNYYLFYLGENPLDQIDFNSYNRLYDNGEYSILQNVELK